MLQILQKQQYTNNFTAMEREPVSKNRVIPKNDRSRKNKMMIGVSLPKLILSVSIILVIFSCASQRTTNRGNAQINVSPGVTLSKQTPIIVVKSSISGYRMKLENALQANGYKVVSPDLIGREEYPTIEVLMEKLRYPTVYLLEWTYNSSYFSNSTQLIIKITDKKTGISIVSGEAYARSSYNDDVFKRLVAEMNKYFR
jgi:hypothetical protein